MKEVNETCGMVRVGKQFVLHIPYQEWFEKEKLSSSLPFNFAEDSAIRNV